jgi:hypothetical protein
VGEFNHNRGIENLLLGWVTELSGKQNQGWAIALATGIDEVASWVLGYRIGIGGCRLQLSFDGL